MRGGPETGSRGLFLLHKEIEYYTRHNTTHPHDRISKDTQVICITGGREGGEK